MQAEAGKFTSALVLSWSHKSIKVPHAVGSEDLTLSYQVGAIGWEGWHKGKYSQAVQSMPWGKGILSLHSQSAKDPSVWSLDFSHTTRTTKTSPAAAEWFGELLSQSLVVPLLSQGELSIILQIAVCLLQQERLKNWLYGFVAGRGSRNDLSRNVSGLSD